MSKHTVGHINIVNDGTTIILYDRGISVIGVLY